MIGCSVVGFFQLDLRRNWSGHMSSEPDQRRQAANEGGRLTKVAFRFCSYKISSRPICSLALLNTRIAGWTAGERQKVGGRAIRADAVDAARGASFAADQDEGPQRGSGRPIPPLVSKFRSQPQTQERERKAA